MLGFSANDAIHENKLCGHPSMAASSVRVPAPALCAHTTCAVSPSCKRLLPPGKLKLLASYLTGPLLIGSWHNTPQPASMHTRCPRLQQCAPCAPTCRTMQGRAAHAPPCLAFCGQCHSAPALYVQQIAPVGFHKRMHGRRMQRRAAPCTYLHARHSAADVRALPRYDESAAQQVAHVRLQRATHVGVQVWRDSRDTMVRCNAPCLQAGLQSKSSCPSHSHTEAGVQIWRACQSVMLRRFAPRRQPHASVMRCMHCTFALQFAPAARMRAVMTALARRWRTRRPRDLAMLARKGRDTTADITGFVECSRAPLRATLKSLPFLPGAGD